MEDLLNKEIGTDLDQQSNEENGDVTKNNETQENNNGEDSWQNNQEWEVDEKIKNIISQFKTPEALAKAIQNSGSEYSKLKSENIAIQELSDKKVYNTEKKLVSKDKMYLLELVQDNDILASKLASEVYGKDLSEILDEIETDLLNQQEIDSITNELLGKNEKTYTKDDFDTLVEIKAAKKLAEKQAKLSEDQESKKIENSYDDFIKNKWFDKWTDEEKVFAWIYNDLIEWKKKTFETVEKVLKASFASFAADNVEYNKQLNEKRQNLKNTGTSTKTWSSNSDTSNYITEEDEVIRKISWMSKERFLELKKKNKY